MTTISSSSILKNLALKVKVSTNKNIFLNKNCLDPAADLQDVPKCCWLFYFCNNISDVNVKFCKRIYKKKKNI